MELVYLWVKEYKNIKNQGFNFSPRFTCKYDEATKELTIEEKEYVNIFPSNINVTAIVGENGSGKSSLIGILYNLLYNLKLNFEFIFVYKNCYLTNIKNLSININLEEKKEFIWHKENIDFYYYSSEKERDSISSEEYFSTNYREGNNYEKKIVLSNYFISQRILEIYKTQESTKNIEISSFFYLPDRVKFSLKPENQILENIFSGADEHFRANCFEHFEYEFLNYETYNGFLLMLYMLRNGLDVNLLEYRDSIPHLLSDAIQYGKNLVSETDFKEYFKNTEYIEIEKLTKKEQIFYFSICHSFFHFEFKDSKNREYEDLSSGEKNLYGQLINIHYYGIKDDNESLIFLFDEPEITLHPNWQRRYIKELNCVAKRLNKRISFFIVSHSPLLLSDLPKENVIFLKKDENGNCKNVSEETNIETFGANIHTLLSHGFFMKDGLMGEFAKSKISKILNFLNGKCKYIDTPLEKIKPTIQIIGEDFLREKLLKMYEDKFPISKKEKIKQLENELKKLKHG